jgi:YidC/Oxa1 family membrane protein insertase
LETGLELWSFDTSEDVLIIMEDARILSSPAVVAGKAIFGASNGNVYCLGGKKNTPAGIAQTGYRSRLMRAANFLMIGLINQLARLTGSYGLALVLGVLILKLLLLPIDWGQTRQLSKLRGLQPDIERMKREYLDYHTLRFEMLKLYAEKGVHPLRIIGLVLLQIPLFVIVFLVIQGTSVFAGKSFLWISDLSSPDRLWKIAFAGSPDFKMNLLPLILIGSIWFYSVAVRGFRRGSGLFRWIVWSLVAIGLGTLTYRWASSVLLFFIAMLWIGMLQQKILSTVQCHTSGTGN